MINSRNFMSRNLSELDKAYGKLNKVATVKEKLKYCASLIQRTESYVTKNREILAETVKKKSFEIIIAAETEIKELSKKIN
jgi:hypothetical protein